MLVLVLVPVLLVLVLSLVLVLLVPLPLVVLPLPLLVPLPLVVLPLPLLVPLPLVVLPLLRPCSKRRQIDHPKCRHFEHGQSSWGAIVSNLVAMWLRHAGRQLARKPVSARRAAMLRSIARVSTSVNVTIEWLSVRLDRCRADTPSIARNQV